MYKCVDTAYLDFRGAGDQCYESSSDIHPGTHIVSIRPRVSHKKVLKYIL
jgi:hypothetical protein